MSNLDNGQLEHSDDLDIAIIGLAGRFPGARSAEEYWRNLADGVEAVSFFSDDELAAEGIAREELAQPQYVKAAAVLQDVELFDAEFFGFSPREAEMMDPQHRVFLECAWEALENAGYANATSSARVGVYASKSLNTYLLAHAQQKLKLGEFILSANNIQAVLGNGHDFLATRVCYKLNLKGPGVTVQTACSSSLVAVHLARQSLLNGECDVALAGGVSIYLPQKVGYLYDPGLILSPDGHCRSFDAEAQGTIFGRGAGLVVLKPLSDAQSDGDRILAVIKGSAINNDGAQKVGYAAPSVMGQAEVIAEAMADAGVEAETIGYLEAHGTGTPQGDPIEIAALNQAYRAETQKKQFCAIGSVKSNIGHCDAASGIAGLIKTVMMLEHKQLPPSLHYQQPNPEIDFANSPFRVNTELTDWSKPAFPRRAAISAFGMGGTNAHMILEEAPKLETSTATTGDDVRDWHSLCLSAKNEPALRELAGRFTERLAETPEESLARFKMDDESVASGITPFKAWVPHGTYQLEVRKVGYDTFKKVVTVRGDKRLFLRVELKKQRTKPKPKPMAAGQRKKIEKPLNLGPKWLPWAVLGGGGVLLAGGVTMAALSNQELSDRDDLIKKAKRDGNEVTLPQLKEHDDAAKAHALTANVLISVGVVAALAGGTLWFLGRRTGPTVAVMPTDGGIGLSVGGPL